ncbi:MAG: amidohydrolase family protein [Planctomycetaceae bacterium]
MSSVAELSRRTMLASTGAVALGHIVSSAFAIDDSTPWIDAHSHIWTTDIARYPLRAGQGLEVLKPASFTADELLKVAQPHGVGRVVLIQHYPYHGFDNSLLIDAWKQRPETFRIVAMVDDQLPHVDVRMRELLKSGVTGFRISARADRSDWLTGAGMELMWQTAAMTRQNICCLINPWELEAIAKWCARYPETPVVIDHFARIGMTGTISQSDLAALCGLSKYPLVRVKISAYYALGSKQPPHTELIPMIRQLFDSFGPDRLMWASDSPYQLTAPSTYASSIGLVREKLEFLSDSDRRKLLRTTAESTYFFA